MSASEKLVPNKKFSPAYFIREQMDLRGWTEMDLANASCMDVREVRSILADHESLTPETAKKISDAFHTSAQFWINLDRHFRLWKREMGQPPL